MPLDVSQRPGWPGLIACSRNRKHRTMTNTAQPQDFWKKTMDESVARLEATYNEAAKLEEKNLEQARSYVEEWAKLSRESIAYTAQLSSEWRRMSLESAKQMASFFVPRG
jgi:hypothetical protein